MTSHLRANLVLVGATLLLCSVAYPLVVWGVASVAFPSNATGGLVHVEDQKEPVGALLIAQEFKGDEYFQPRPSFISYNASGSGASNYGANNPKLRGAVAARLGPIVKFRNGTDVGPVVEKWAVEKPDRLVDWAKRYPTLASAWAKPDPSNELVATWLGTPNLEPSFLISDFVVAQLKKHAAIVKTWKEKHPDDSDTDVFYPVFAEEYPGTIPSMSATSIGAVGEGSDVQGWYFDMWLQEHPDAELKPVPADMVTSSGSGLDPHITLRNAEYQVNRVAHGWAVKNDKLKEDEVRQYVTLVINTKASSPLLGFVGEPLVNVLEVNLELRKKYGSAAK